MKKLKWNRALTILVLMMFVTVTYASFNTNLFIDGKAYVRVDKDIRITNIHLLETEYDGYENVDSEYTNRTISTDVSLPRQASSVTYEVTVSNVSDKRYKITDILEENYSNKNVRYEVIDAAIGNIVEPHTEKTFRVKFTNNVTVVEEDDVYQTLTYTFDYTGEEQEFVVPYDGTYKIELWGARGIDKAGIGGAGGYTSGKINLTKNEKLYIYVGQKNQSSSKFNASNYTKYSVYSSGATDIRTIAGKWDNFDSLKSRIMVAGAGGMAGGTNTDRTHPGGAGGGLVGYAGGNGGNGASPGNGATQVSGQSFGLGNLVEHQWGAPGANGYFAGKSGSGGNDQGSAGGGSSYISGHPGCVSITSDSKKDNISFVNDSNGIACNSTSSNGYNSAGYNMDSACNKHYSGKVFTETVMIDGKGYAWNENGKSETSTGMPTHDGTSTMTGNSGNGYAKITLTRKIEDGTIYDFDFTGGEQIFTVPYTGLYRLETWGAQGSTYVNGIGGYGGYSRGFINLIKGENLYINVGEKSVDKPYGRQQPVTGGYNGGGSSGDSGGGGATHIASISGLLSSLESYKDDIIIVAGGGGGGERTAGGSGGGYIGNTGNFGYNNAHISGATGGSQLAGGVGSVINPEASTYIKYGDGESGGFGQGAVSCMTDTCGAGAGGGGYFGGGSSHYASGGGGGSGYIANSRLTDKVMYCYKCLESQNLDIKTVKTNSHSKLPKQNVAKEGNGYSRITLFKRTINQTKLTLDFTFEEYVNGNETVFSYTGEPQEFIATRTGYYKIELWGARGGYDNGSYGGYTSGIVKLIKGSELYVYVGQRRLDRNTISFNGGHASADGQPGGGATDIRLVSSDWDNAESLNSRIMVAGGGGAYAGVSPNLGYGGGLHGGVSYASNNYNTSSMSTPSTQTEAGGSGVSCGLLYPSGFGVGGSCAGGGGGYYGGAGSSGNAGGGSGGSSYISGHNGCVAITSANDRTPRNDSNGIQCVDGTTDITCSKHYSNYEFTDTVMIDGAGYSWTTERSSEYSGMPTHDGSTTMTGNDGDGFAKITLLEEIPEYHFDYTGDVQEFDAPYNGIYKVELWGASGYDLNNLVGGKGAYTSGKIELEKNQKLYLYVGGNAYVNGYNGIIGPKGKNDNLDYFGTGGGGSTDVRFVKSTWDNFDSLKSRLMVAAGGGGVANRGDGYGNWNGGSGGGLVGYDGQGTDGYCHAATQINPGACHMNYEDRYVSSDFGKTFNGTRITGGSGYYAGSGSYHVSGSGGSSYISGHVGCVSITEESTSENISFVNDSNEVACNDENSTGYNSLGYNTDSACNKHYSGYEFYDTIMIDGKGYAWDSSGVGNTVIGMPSPDGRTTMIGNTGNGYAKITLIQKSTDVVRDNLTMYLDAKDRGNTEGVWEDKSGNGLNGTLTGNSYFYNNALILNANGDGVDMQNQLIDLFKSSFTLEFFVNVSGIDDRDLFMGNYPTNHSIGIERGRWTTEVNQSGRFWFDEGHPDKMSDHNYIEFNKNVQLFYIFDKENNKFIFGYNGAFISDLKSELYAANYDFTGSYFFRDKRTDNTGFNGKAYSVRIYDRKLSYDELTSNFIFDKNYYK